MMINIQKKESEFIWLIFLTVLSEVKDDLLTV